MSIWQHDFPEKKDVPEQWQLTLGEGNTPLNILQVDGVELAVKDENVNPNGSFKDRSLAFQISYHASQGITDFVISSSGNAAISAAAYLNIVEKANLKIFVSDHINPAKLAKLNALTSEKNVMVQSNSPKSDAIKAAAENSAFNLRGSRDDKAKVGYKTIAYEIAKDYPQVDAIFIPCSSGTSTIGIYEGFKEKDLFPQIHIVQTSKINTIAKELDNNFIASESSLADAITDRVAHRKQEVLSAIKQTKGNGWVATDVELEEAKEKINSEYSYNSLLAFAGYFKAVKAGNQFKAPLILASGL
jgi:threonine synthase